MHPMKLIFVYNSDAGLFNIVTDIAHKIFSPGTYSCKLCGLTHGYFNIRNDWAIFIAELKNTFNIESEFLHRDEFVKLYKIKNLELPAVYKCLNGKLEILLNKKEIEKLGTLRDLMNVIQKHLESIT
jgi:hypothetical protein